MVIVAHQHQQAGSYHLRAGVVEEELCGKLMLFLRRGGGGGD
jgi:hypothetical protein